MRVAVGRREREVTCLHLCGVTWRRRRHPLVSCLLACVAMQPLALLLYFYCMVTYNLQDIKRLVPPIRAQLNQRCHLRAVELHEIAVRAPRILLVASIPARNGEEGFD